MCPGNLRVRSGAFSRFTSAAFGQSVRTLGVVGFFRVLSVNSQAPWLSSGSFGCFRPIHVCPVCLNVRSFHSRGSCVCRVDSPLPCALEIVVFIRVRSVASHAPCVSSGSLSAHSCAPLESSASFGCVRSGTIGAFLCALCDVGCDWFIPVRPLGRRVR